MNCMKIKAITNNDNLVIYDQGGSDTTIKIWWSPAWRIKHAQRKINTQTPCRPNPNSKFANHRYNQNLNK